MDNLNLNIVDYLLIVIFLFSMIRGFSRGLVLEIIGLLSFIAAVVVAVAFAGPLSEHFTNAPAVQSVVNQASSAIGVSTSQPVSYVALAVSFGLLFAGVVIIGSIVGFILNLFFMYGVLGLGNRVLGAAFGFGRGFILCMVIVFIVQLTPFVTAPLWQRSQLVSSFQPAVGWLGGIVSPSLANIRSRFSETIQDVNSSLHNITK